MVRSQLRARGIADERVLAAMETVPREEFVEPGDRDVAYEDCARAIPHGQTISQPYMVAYTLEQARIRPTDRLLDIGTGSGYAAAVASLVAGEVTSIERIPALAAVAGGTLARLGYRVQVVHGDGSRGLPGRAPFDVIVSAAAAEAVPSAWKNQLAEGGRIVAPVGDDLDQRLVRVTRTAGGFVTEPLIAVRYVPLIQDPPEE